VFENLTKDQACNKEKALIKLFNTTDHDFGFNLTAGGEGVTELPLEIRDQINLKNTKYIISKQELKYYYLDLKKSIRECADYFGCSACVIQNNLNKFGIETRHNKKFDIAKEDLINLLVNEHKTRQDAANILGCSLATIEKYQRKFCINIKKVYNFDLDEVIYQYITLNKSRIDVADYFGCSESTLKRFMTANNIKKLKN
jgi:AraC-like DNA-binding protein